MLARFFIDRPVLAWVISILIILLGAIAAGFLPVAEYPEVLECHRITGAESYIMKVALRSVEHLQELIDRLMEYGETVTSIVLSSPVTHRVVDPTALAVGVAATA